MMARSVANPPPSATGGDLPEASKNLSRRAVIMGALAASASCPLLARAQTAAPAMPGGNAPPTILHLQRRPIEVNGGPAPAFGIRQPDGTFGITTDLGKPF